MALKSVTQGAEFGSTRADEDDDDAMLPIIPSAPREEAETTAGQAPSRPTSAASTRPQAVLTTVPQMPPAVAPALHLSSVILVARTHHLEDT